MLFINFQFVVVGFDISPTILPAGYAKFCLLQSERYLCDRIAACDLFPGLESSCFFHLMRDILLRKFKVSACYWSEALPRQ